MEALRAKHFLSPNPYRKGSAFFYPRHSLAGARTGLTGRVHSGWRGLFCPGHVLAVTFLVSVLAFGLWVFGNGHT